MILALLIGCLTPETFAERYVDLMCEEVDECAAEGADTPMCSTDYDETVAGLGSSVDCPAWDAAAAADCLDARAARSECGDAWDSAACEVVLHACR